MKARCLFIFGCTFVLWAPLNICKAQTLRVAVAANLQGLIKTLGADFKNRTGIVVEPVIGSSGKLVAQISNGAPYDVFLSADMAYPRKLSENGMAEQAPVVYALGSLIICSNTPIPHSWQQLIVSDKAQKVALANPKLAPYGRAAIACLKKLNLLERIKPKMVYGESISQVNNYISTGAVTLCFTSQSAVKDAAGHSRLYWQLIDPGTYAPIEQGMVILKYARLHEKAARRFYNYMLGAHDKNILKKYGYVVP